MPSEELGQKNFPWCTLFLVVGALTCHTLVLTGNYQTANAMNSLGTSTSGWSRVGLGIGQALEVELDAKMSEVSGFLLEGIQHIAFIQDSMDVLISVVGNETDKAISETPELALLQKNPRALHLLQTDPDGEGSEYSGALEALIPVIKDSVHQVLTKLMTKVEQLLDRFLVVIKPTLKTVSVWISKFGDKIQSGIEQFTVTLDRVQKIFDQLMSQLNGNGENLEEMLQESYSLFNIDGTGDIDALDLKVVADMYSITALQGNKSVELVEKYDDSGDGELQFAEMANLVDDPTLPNLVTNVLRTFAKRMSEIGGNVAAARMRDEVAGSVAQYLGLVCAKNLTRMEWVADALSNGSVPTEFTADLLAQLCLNEDDPNMLTSGDTGPKVAEAMYKLHPGHSLRALDLLSNATFWESEGFDVKDQPACMKKVTAWMANIRAVTPIDEPGQSAYQRGNGTVVQMLAGSFKTAPEPAVLLAMPAMAQQLAEQGVALHLLDKQRVRQRARAQLFSSKTSQVLLHHLLGGAAPSDHKQSSAAERAKGAGQPARPETLQFARWLANNATSRADVYQSMCFEYSSESSSAMDSFATQIQAMVSKVQSFLNIMMRYATPSAIQRLEDQFKDFVDNALGDVVKVVETQLVVILHKEAPILESGIRHAAHEAGERIGSAMGAALGTPMGQSLKAPIGDLVNQLAEGSDSPAGGVITDQLGDTLASAIADLSEQILGQTAGDAFENVVMDALKTGSGKLLTQSSLSQLDSKQQQEGLPAVVSGVWQKMVNVLKALTNTLPAAANALKFARKEVSKLSTNLNSIFEVFHDKGPPIFDDVAHLWRTLWTIYFLCLLPLNIFILYYAVWSGGYVHGGPQPLSPDEKKAYEAPRTMRERFNCCGLSCFACMKNTHDTALCFWSLIILLEVLVLVIFIIGIALCALAGVKAFMVAGCAQIYVINDVTICQEALGTVQSFLSTFAVKDALESLDDACGANQLLACEHLSKKMMASTILTTVFSLLGTLLSLQMIITSAIQHEQARFRRILLSEKYEGKVGAP